MKNDGDRYGFRCKAVADMMAATLRQAERPIGPYAMKKQLGATDNEISCALVYLTECEPRIAETDDGKIFYVQEGI